MLLGTAAAAKSLQSCPTLCNPIDATRLRCSKTIAATTVGVDLQVDSHLGCAPGQSVFQLCSLSGKNRSSSSMCMS